MNHLKYPQKFTLISCVFILPLGLVMYLLLSEIQNRIDFARKEMLGTAYLRPLRQISATLAQLPEETLQPQMIDNLNILETTDQKLGKTLQTTDKFQPFKQTWQLLAKNQASWNSEIRASYYELATRQVDLLRSQVGDQSNLILDPDLDTYYLMDATLLKLPVIQKTLVGIRAISQKAIARKQLTSIEQAQLIMLLGILKDYNSELRENMEVAFNSNSTKTLRSRLTSTLTVFTKNLEQLTNQANEINTLDSAIRSSKYFAETEQYLEQSFRLWDETINELDQLLQHRIEGFIKKQLLLTSFVLVILTVVVYLFIGFYIGLMQLVSRLSAASKQMIDGTLTEAITLDSRDELAEVVHSFNDIAVALVKANQEVSLLNQRLETENLRMSAELEITHRLQQMILPKEEELQQVVGLDIAGFMEPAAEIGGDYYDVLQQGGRVKIGIGDVTGHGLESGVVMIMAQTAVRTLLVNGETNPVKLLNAVNRMIYENTRRMKSYKNMTLVLLEYEAGVLRLSGQHEELVIVRTDGKVEQIDTMDLGFPLGIESDITPFVAEAEVQLHPGDLAVLYTDGVTEAINYKKEQYGPERVYAILKRNRSKTASEIRQAVIDDVMQHIGQQKVFDDITLLVLKQK